MVRGDRFKPNLENVSGIDPLRCAAGTIYRHVVNAGMVPDLALARSWPAGSFRGSQMPGSVNTSSV